jgi:uncharacterized C2H2 Zn-finger protein
MTFADQLRAIAERLDEAERLRVSALDDLAALTGDVIEQPSQAAGADAAAPVLDVSPVEAPAPSAPNRAGAVRDDHGRRSTRPESAGSTPAPRSTPSPTQLAGGGFECPVCKRFFADQRGYPAHARGHQGIPPSQLNGKERGASPPLIGKAAQATQPVIRHGRESYLCSRCPQSFASLAQLTAHMQKGHPPAPAAPTRPFGPQLSVERSGGGASVTSLVAA